MKIACQRVKEICLKNLKEKKADAGLFDQITGQLAAVGIDIDWENTARARQQSPTVIAVFKIEADAWFASVAETDVIVWNDSARNRVLDKVKEVCLKALEGADPTDGTLFDRITEQIAAAGALIDRAATRKVRTHSPNIVAVYSESQCPSALVFLKVFGEDVATHGYCDDVEANLTPASKIPDYSDEYYLTATDLSGLRFIERDGQRWYDSDDLQRIAVRKEEERKSRHEAMRNISLIVPDQFLELCQEVNTTPAAVLERFIADLCHLHVVPSIINNRDEGLLTGQSFERFGYQHMAERNRKEEEQSHK